MTKKQRTLISISIPVYNEEGNIKRLYGRLCTLSERVRDRCDLEFVFSDNHSTDGTWAQLRDLAQRDTRIKALRFSRNFGFQRSILANFLHTRGDAVMQLDADLQDPPEMLESFLDRWESGYMVVYGIRKRRPESKALQAFRRFGYWVIDKLSEQSMPMDAGDFRLIDRRVIESLAQMRAINPYLRGMIASLGFRQIGIEYDRDARVAGESKFGISRLVNLGMLAVFNHSSVPLRVASLIGSAILSISFLGAVYYFLLRLFAPDLPEGLASIHILVLFGIGLNSLFLGIIGEYLMRIYLMLRNDPVAIIEQTLNFQKSDLKM